MKSIEIEQKSIEIDNHKNDCDRFLSISDICRLINIDFYRLLSIWIEYRNYRFVMPCVNDDNKSLLKFLLAVAVAVAGACSWTGRCFGPAKVQRN